MTNEPTTGELIEQLHTFDNVDAVTITIAKAALLFIADRLESQERELSGIAGELEAMTARAEQAEAREKAIIRCSECARLDVINSDIVYAQCKKYAFVFFPFEADTRETGCTHGERGLPQDGEGL